MGLMSIVEVMMIAVAMITITPATIVTAMVIVAIDMVVAVEEMFVTGTRLSRRADRLRYQLAVAPEAVESLWKSETIAASRPAPAK